MLSLGLQDYTDPTPSESNAPLEKILLGMILFIPGIYHTIVACLVAFDSGDFTYDDVATFESDEWWDDKNK